MGLLSGYFSEETAPEQRPIIATDFDQWVRFMHELVESRPHENYVWYDDGCSSLH